MRAQGGWVSEAAGGLVRHAALGLTPFPMVTAGPSSTGGGGGRDARGGRGGPLIGEVKNYTTLHPLHLAAELAWTMDYADQPLGADRLGAG